MKNLAINLTLFIFLSIALSSFTGCRNSDATNSTNMQTSAKKNDYPAMPASIMQADIKSVEGNIFKLEDYKGKIVLVNLWATWCGPCKAEMPELVKLQDEYKEKGFVIVGLDTDVDNDDADKVKEFAQKMNLNYQLGWADDKTYDDFLNISRFNGIPQSFLIDREGKLNGIFFGGGQNTINKMKESVGNLANAN